MKASVRRIGERATAAIIAALLVAALIATPRDGSAQQSTFSLAVGQSVTVGTFTIQFLGRAGNYPSYHVYRDGSLFARFPSDPPAPNWSIYVYQNISIETTAVAPDGSAVTGTFTAK